MGICDGDEVVGRTGHGLPRLDAFFKRVLVCVNVTGEVHTLQDVALVRDLAGVEMSLHPLMAGDAVVAAGARCAGGAPVVPPHSVAVFVELR